MTWRRIACGVVWGIQVVRDLLTRERRSSGLRERGGPLPGAGLGESLVLSHDLRIPHWNIHSWRDPSGHANVAAVAALIGETAPDIVSLAEVDEAWWHLDPCAIWPTAAATRGIRASPRASRYMDETDEFKVAFRQSGYGTTVRDDTSVTCVDGGAGDANVTIVK